MQQPALPRNHIQLFTIAASLLLSGVFFWFHFFPSKMYLGEYGFPLWFFVGCILVLTLLFLWMISYFTQQPLRFLMAIVFTPALTWHIATSLHNAEPWKGELLWLSVIWGWCLAELIVTIAPTVFTTIFKQRLLWVAFIVTVAAALAVRFHLLDPLHPGLLFLVLLWMLVLRLLPTTAIAKNPLHQRIGMALTLLFVLWGSGIRIAAVDTFVFQNDEYFHVNTSVGYLKTGEYKQWNFVSETATADYVRTKAYTWQVAQSVRLFGQSEWAMRLPALIWGILLLLVVPLVTYAWTRSWMASAFATALIAFDTSLVWSSTYTRMYSWFFVMVLVGVWMFWQSMQIEKKRLVWQRCAWLAGALFFTSVAVWIHISGLLLFGGMAVALLFLWLQQPQERWYRWLLLFTVAAAAAAGIAELLHPYLPWYFFVIRKDPLDQYLHYPAQYILVPCMAIVGVLGAAVMVYQKRAVPTWITIAYGIAFPLIIYFTYFANRYGARKYSLFFFPLFFILIAWVWTRVSQSLSRTVWVQYAMGTVGFLLIFVQMSIPGVSPSWLFSKARADHTYRELENYDYKTAYNLIAQKAIPGDVLIISSPKSYYLAGTTMPIIPLEGGKRMTSDAIEAMIDQHPHGWIVWPSQTTHVSRAVKDHVRAHYTVLPAPNTGMSIYYWSGQ